MNNIYVTARDCTRSEFDWLAELLQKNHELQLVLSYDLPEKQKEQDARQARLSSVLVNMGIKPNLKGYQYLKTAVSLCLEDREELEGVTKRLYPSVAKQHGTSADKVEHAIRHAIQSAWMRGCFEEQKRIFGYHAGTKKHPTNSEFIVRIVDYMTGMGSKWYS